MLLDEEAERIEREASRADRPTLERWVKALLDDRRARTAMLQGQTRRVAYAMRRLRQATDYLAGLLQMAQEEAAAAWPGKLPCPHCGAPSVRVRAEQRPQGHEIVHDHPDGVHCTPTGTRSPEPPTSSARTQAPSARTRRP